MQRGAIGRGDNADPLRQGGNRLLARGIEKPFFFQLGFQLLKRQLKSPLPCGSMVAATIWNLP